MIEGAIDAALSLLKKTGRAKIRVMTQDNRATEIRLRNRAAWISKPNARLRVVSVEDGDGFLDVDLMLDGVQRV
ncbi:MAG TPA: hypothetical protein VFP67_04730 [Acidimicrobiia bacterium]|jgi:hypothetical protein|nr:hypothetical protein [Acidimicrobiia bacterium]